MKFPNGEEVDLNQLQESVEVFAMIEINKTYAYLTVVKYISMILFVSVLLNLVYGESNYWIHIIIGLVYVIMAIFYLNNNLLFYINIITGTLDLVDIFKSLAMSQIAKVYVIYKEREMEK